MLMHNAMASGSRRTCAALAIGNALNASDLVAAVIDPAHQDSLVESLRYELSEADGDHVSVVRDLILPAMERFCEANGVPAERPFREDLDHLRALLTNGGGHRRAVLIWHGPDRLISECPSLFDGAVETLCAVVSDTPNGCSTRVVLVGSEKLLKHLERMESDALESVRFRYIVVR